MKFSSPKSINLVTFASAINSIRIPFALLRLSGSISIRPFARILAALTITLDGFGGQSAAALAQVPGDSPDLNPRTVYFTTGDNQDLLGLPLDSENSIEAAFDSLHKLYRVSRVWWRGGQDEVWGKEFVLRPENREFARLWEWWRHLANEEVDTNRIAVRAAHDRGMEIWMAYGLFDNGSSADTAYVGYPYAIEDRLRVEHPEWAPLNRYGTRRQGGPIEFAYPEARRAMVEYLARHVIEGGYDGIAFLTYAENYSQRYEDEFGFNPPIVEEFQRRHGVDIRSEAFDQEAWSRLRGEYLTEFLRELKAALAPHGKRIAVCVDTANPRLPVLWNVSGGVRTAGRIHMDIDTWAREGLVDEITVWPGRDEATIQQVADVCRGTQAKASSLRTRGSLPEGALRVMFLGPDIETGFPWENYVDWPDENVPQQPDAALTDSDPYARRRFLTAVLKGKQQAQIADLSAAVGDEDLYVRLLALRGLAIGRDPEAIPAIEAALVDPENSVRCQAALALGQVADGGCVKTLFDAIARDESTFQFNFRAVPEALKQLHADGKLGKEEKEYLVEQLASPNPRVRESALYVFLRVGAPATPDCETALVGIARRDAGPYAREMAMANLRSSFGPSPIVLDVVREAMNGRDQALQVRAAAHLGNMLAGADTQTDARRAALAELADLFAQYGDGTNRTEAEWGWRVIGAAILAFGDDGRAVLEKMLADREDRRLAELAWHLLFIPQGDQFFPVTAEEDRQAHLRHPFVGSTLE